MREVVDETGLAGERRQHERRGLPVRQRQPVEAQHPLRAGDAVDAFGKLPSTDFILVGALTELNYNIVTGGVGLRVAGVGGGARMAVVNVALDLRVINSKNFAVSYVSSLQKQIYGYEVEADVFRFWDFYACSERRVTELCNLAYGYFDAGDFSTAATDAFLRAARIDDLAEPGLH